MINMLKSVLYSNNIVFGFEYLLNNKIEFVYAAEAKEIIEKGNMIKGLNLSFSGDTWSCFDCDINSVPKYSFENNFYMISNGVITGLSIIAEHFINIGCYKILLPQIVDGEIVKMIGREAFRNANFFEIVLPESLTKIGVDAFSYSSIRTVKIPDSCEKICENAFSDCYDLEVLNLGEGVKSIGLNAFYECRGLDNTEIFIPYSVEEIGEDTFGGIEDVDFTIDNSVGHIRTLRTNDIDEDYEEDFEEEYDDDYEDEFDDFDDGYVEYFYGAYNVKVEYLR